MEIRVQQAQEDQYGNVKENIFLAFDEENSYLGNGFIYPMINVHQTNETPYLLYFGIDVNEHLQAEEIREQLLDAVMIRADELRKLKPDIPCRIYTGFEWNKEKMEFYLKHGFQEDYSIFMEADLTQKKICELSPKIEVEEFSVMEPAKFTEFKAVYDEYFVTPLDEGYVMAQKEDPSFKNYKFYVNDELAGEYSVRIEDDCGFIETLFVLEQKRGQGIAKLMMEYIHQSFLAQGIQKAKLEVWELNRRAWKMYQSCGYREIQKNNMFPGKTV